ncbi:hypothetical protein GGR51DRAFT_564307 [Nemania sp. FL0031]|nr:hypothetical protein GGR51DRAFT_564307 [Nemania sp. FL0031]
MDQYLPLNRISLASLDDDQFFSAHSTQPPSRLMSTFAPRGDGLLPEDASVVAFDRGENQQPLAALKATSFSQDTSTTSSSALEDRLVSSPAPAITTRRWSSVTGREQSLTACHYQGRLPLAARPQPDGYINKQEFNGILSNIRAYLSTRQHTAASRKPVPIVTNENDVPVSSLQSLPHTPYLELAELPEDQYLVSADNIAKILDIVVSGVRGIQADSAQPDCQSLLFSNGTYAKPTLQNQSIIPGMPAGADPATTICSPRPCFSAADGFEESRRLHSTPKTTYNDVCHDDVYLNCFDDGATGAEFSEPSEPVPSVDNCRGRYRSWPQSSQIARRVSFRPSPPQASFNPFEEQFHQARKRSISEPLPQIQPKDEVMHAATPAPMTSFPRLMSRSCTSDWLTPLGLYDDVENDELSEFQTTMPSLYSSGIDAHSGIPICKPLPILEEGSQATSTSPRHSPLQACHSSVQKRENRVSSQDDHLHEDDEERVGCSIGAASHRRIRIREPQGRRQDTNQNLFDGLRHYKFMPALDQAPEYIYTERLPHPSWMKAALAEDQAQKRSSRDLLQRILRQSNPSSTRSSRSNSS